MRTPISFIHRVFAVAVAAGFVALTAHADTANYDKPNSAEPAKPVGPSANNETFRKLRTQCETEVACGKASGDVCVEAAMLLVGTDLPDEFREVAEDQRVKIALRLLERGTDTSNLARARAYDWYSKIGFLGVNAYADPYRSKELMDMMIKSNYPGGVLRKARETVGILSFSSEAEKRANCAATKTLLAEGKLDPDGVAVAKEILQAGSCTAMEQPK